MAEELEELSEPPKVEENIRLGCCPKHGSWTRRDLSDEMTCPGYMVRVKDEFVRKPCGLKDVTAEWDRKNQVDEEAEKRGAE